MKKSYALIITILLVSFFTYNMLFIFQNKAISTHNNQNNYLYTQALLHLDFLSTYVKKLNLENTCYENIKIKNDKFLLNIILNYDCTNYKEAEVHLFAVSKKYNISLHKFFLLKKETN